MKIIRNTRNREEQWVSEHVMRAMNNRNEQILQQHQKEEKNRHSIGIEKPSLFYENIYSSSSFSFLSLVFTIACFLPDGIVLNWIKTVTLFLFFFELAQTAPCIFCPYANIRVEKRKQTMRGQFVLFSVFIFLLFYHVSISLPSFFFNLISKFKN